MRAGVLEDLQHTGAGDVPDLWAELLSVQDHQVFQTVCPRPSQLLVVCGRQVKASKHICHIQILLTSLRFTMCLSGTASFVIMLTLVIANLTSNVQTCGYVKFIVPFTY